MRSKLWGKCLSIMEAMWKCSGRESLLAVIPRISEQASIAQVIKEQAERWAKRYATPVVNIYSLLINEKLDILEFKEMTDEWLDFIIACRSGKPHQHDIVIGAMANDQIYNYVSDYIDGVITREQFWMLAKFKYPTHQINFCTEQALSCLAFYKSEAVRK